MERNNPSSDSEEEERDDVHNEPPPELNQRRSGRNRTEVNYRGMSVEINDQQVYCFAVLPEQFQPAITDLPTPKSYKKALESTERDDWMKACDKEMKSLNDKNVWVLVDRPSHKKVL